jgi:carboxylate-amine ligase
MGIEEEYQLVDPNTGELVSRYATISKGKKTVLGEKVAFKPELHQSVIEVDTPVCETAGEAREKLVKMRKQVHHLASERGLAFCAASTHPFSDWKEQKITNKPRYLEIVRDMQDLARANLIFGMHVHIAIPDKELAIEVVNKARHFLPHLLALSTSSPFWLGRKTGLMSHRSIIFKRFPRTGLPEAFTSYAEYERFVDLLVRTETLQDASKIWWDLRVHHKYPTIEFRIFDLPTRVDESIAIAALTQALVAKLIYLKRRSLTIPQYRRALIEENKWRAIRWGLDGTMVDFGVREAIQCRQIILEILGFVDEVVDDLGCRKEIEYIHEILDNGTSAHRQLRVFKETGDLRDVVTHLIADTMHGVE